MTDRYKFNRRRENDDVSRAFSQLERFAQILRPEDVREPILGDAVRAAVFEWMTELRNEDLLATVNVEPRRMCLLYGPPGTGKTTLAHHIAARFGMPLIAVQCEKLVEGVLGATTQNLGALFDLLETVEKSAVVLFDEFDALATKRTEDRGGGAQNEMNRALTVILRRMEQFRGIALAATNTADVIDAAIWRRFGLQLHVELPEMDERFAIIKQYAAPYDLPDIDVDNLVDLTAGCSPSLLKQLMEGMKRALVLADKLRRKVDDPVEVFSHVRASIAPPPELERPALWEKRDSIRSLQAMQWPPKRYEEREDAA